jgi:multiple antibiotic resistance protein
MVPVNNLDKHRGKAFAQLAMPESRLRIARASAVRSDFELLEIGLKSTGLLALPVFSAILPPPGAGLLHAAKTILLFLSALFPIVNPLGGSPIYLSLTREYSRESRMLLAERVAMNSFILLVVSFLIGTHILAFFGISLPIVQIGGGLIVISTGWAMLKSKDEDERSEVHQSVSPQDLFRNAFYPLTLPLTVGPGSISVAITLGANEPHQFGFNFVGIIAAVIGSALVALSVLVCYGFADRLATLLGATAMSVIMRLSSFLLVCIGVQILWNGASALLKTLPEFSH